MQKLTEILSYVAAGLATLFGVFYVMKSKAEDSAAKNEAIADEHEEQAELAGLVSIEERQAELEQLEKAREVATSTKFMAENEKANHKDGDGWTWSDAKSK